MLSRAMFSMLLFVCLTVSVRELSAQVLFDFSDVESDEQWQSVNDGVMGGRSEGAFRISQSGILTFTGRISLANNGGFASIRSRGKKLELRENDTILLRVKGDGRLYTLNLYVPTLRIAYSYRVDFPTKADEWIDVRIPLSQFVATSFGRVVKNADPVTAAKVNSIGFMLSDKKAGPFELEVDWIKREANTKTSRRSTD